jgi:hypothetical protein
LNFKAAAAACGTPLSKSAGYEKWYPVGDEQKSRQGKDDGAYQLCDDDNENFLEGTLETGPTDVRKFLCAAEMISRRPARQPDDGFVAWIQLVDATHLEAA